MPLRAVSASPTQQRTRLEYLRLSVPIIELPRAHSRLSVACTTIFSMTTKPITTKRGRQPDANSKSGQIRELLKTGMSPADIAKKLGCTPALVYNVKARAAGGGAKSGGAKRKPGRPAKAKPAATKGAAASSLDGISAILDAVKNSETERKQMRAALERIQTVIRDVLA